MPRIAIILTYLFAVVLFSATVGWLGFRAGVDQVAERGNADLRSAAERLTGQLARFRQIAVMLADHPEILQLAQSGENADTAIQVMRRTADHTGAMQIALLDRDARVLGAASENSTTAAETDGFERAMTGALGAGNSALPNLRRTYSFYAPVFDLAGVVGVLAVWVDLETIEESDWRGRPEVVFFTQENGQVFVTNRSELLFRAVGQREHDFGPTREIILGEQTTLWLDPGSRYLPRRSVYVRDTFHVIGMDGHALLSTRAAERFAFLQAAIAAALCLIFGGVILWVAERRRTLSLANIQLEARVEERTAELRRAQVDLIQAGKLSALGQMSAGISHELNQPLMAIRSFSENAQQFLDRGNTDIARDNLGRIAELSRRMARIIKNLRAFARGENEPMTRVNIVSVIEAALELAEPRMKGENISCQWDRPDGPVWVRGGDVRLQQVMMNLISNAMDAMAGEGALYLTVSRQADTVFVEVRDTGPGLSEPEKIFDPFYTTKEVGADGMGLGLSISYGLVQSFGGNIRGRNHPDGGAVFTVELAAEVS